MGRDQVLLHLSWMSGRVLPCKCLAASDTIWDLIIHVSSCMKIKIDELMLVVKVDKERCNPMLIGDKDLVEVPDGSALSIYMVPGGIAAGSNSFSLWLPPKISDVGMENGATITCIHTKP